MTVIWKPSGMLGTVDFVVLSAIVENSDTLVTEFIKGVRALLGSTAILKEPCVAFTTSRIVLGEHDDVHAIDPEDTVREFLVFPAWRDFTASAVAELLLLKEAETFRSLMTVAITVGAIDEYGTNCERDQALFEKINEFAAVAMDKMFMETLA